MEINPVFNPATKVLLTGHLRTVFCLCVKTSWETIHINQSFPYKRLFTRTHFETEAHDNTKWPISKPVLFFTHLQALVNTVQHNRAYKK